MKIVAIANQKGGVAKTTTTGALAAGLKRRGFKVLAVDLDPQGNLSDSAGADNEDKSTVYEMLKGDASAAECIQHVDAFDIIPANIMLASAEMEFSMTGREHKLKKGLSPIMENYDYIIIDCPPSLGVLTVNAFTAANEIIIPTTPGIFAASGIMKLFDSVKVVKEYCNRDLKIKGILFTKYNARTTISQDIKDLTETLGENIGAPIFKTFIRSSVMVEEAQANHVDIFTYSSKNNVSEDYNSFIDEYLKGE